MRMEAPMSDSMAKGILIDMLPPTQREQMYAQIHMFKTYASAKGRIIDMISNTTTGQAPMNLNPLDADDEPWCQPVAGEGEEGGIIV